MSPKCQPRKPWPGYFIIRTTGEVVPLIAVDELPQDIDIIGIPREIDLGDAIGMLNLGLQEGCGDYYKITHKKVQIWDENTGQVENCPTQLNTTTTVPPIFTHLQAGLSTKASSTTDLSTSLQATSTLNPATNQQTARPQICRYWCVNGICRWGLQCHHRHAMPTSLKGLQDIGLNDWPVWYRRSNPGWFVNDVGFDKARNIRPNDGKTDGKNVRRATSVNREEDDGKRFLRMLISSERSKIEKAGDMTVTGAKGNGDSSRFVAEGTREWEEDESTVNGDEDAYVSSPSGEDGKKALSKGRLVDV